MAEHLLEIEIGLCDGSTARFVQDDPKLAEQAVRRMEPSRVFDQSSVVIGGDHHVSAFSTANISHIELRSELLPDWSFGTNFDRIEVVDRADFDRWVGELRDVDRKALHIRAGEEVQFHMLFTLCGGHEFPMELHAKALPSTVRAGRITRMFDGDTFHARRGAAAAVLINVKNLIATRVYPGMPELPPNAIEAREPNHWRPETPS